MNAASVFVIGLLLLTANLSLGAMLAPNRAGSRLADRLVWLWWLLIMAVLNVCAWALVLWEAAAVHSPLEAVLRSAACLVFVGGRDGGFAAPWGALAPLIALNGLLLLPMLWLQLHSRNVALKKQDDTAQMMENLMRLEAKTEDSGEHLATPHPPEDSAVVSVTTNATAALESLHTFQKPPPLPSALTTPIAATTTANTPSDTAAIAIMPASTVTPVPDEQAVPAVTVTESAVADSRAVSFHFSDNQRLETLEPDACPTAPPAAAEHSPPPTTQDALEPKPPSPASTSKAWDFYPPLPKVQHSRTKLSPEEELAEQLKPIPPTPPPIRFEWGAGR
jgi:hypothetical protein